MNLVCQDFKLTTIGLHALEIVWFLLNDESLESTKLAAFAGAKFILISNDKY